MTLSLPGELRRGVRILVEYIKGGGRWRERILHYLLSLHYSSKFKRQWLLARSCPHFEDKRIFIYDMAFSGKGCGPYPFFTGFYGAEVVKARDVMLDIGCGDGFFTKCFYSEKCSVIDALDVDPLAIEVARIYHTSPKIHYFVQDAVIHNFPRDHYDVICLDGAIGHLRRIDMDVLLQKIKNGLGEEGVFIGSESLGEEGDDHLQYFQAWEDLDKVFQPYFRYAKFREVRYPLKWAHDYQRTEVFWRCSNSLERMDKLGWSSRRE